MFDFLKRREKKKKKELPAILQPENPVNYNSVLDYMIGLSDKDYKKLTASADVYRKANKDVAKIVGIKDEPTHSLMPEKPTEEQIDKDLDTLLDEPDLSTAFLDDDEPKVDTITKPQAPATPKQIEIKD